jgi:hypothetical protein
MQSQHAIAAMVLRRGMQGRLYLSAGGEGEWSETRDGRENECLFRLCMDLKDRSAAAAAKAAGWQWLPTKVESFRDWGGLGGTEGTGRG